MTRIKVGKIGKSRNRAFAEGETRKCKFKGNGLWPIVLLTNAG
jgi:hypothetical protein